MNESHPTDREILDAAIATIRDVLAPELRTAWAKSTAAQLIGMLQYAGAREEGRVDRQDAELAAAIDGVLAAHQGTAPLPHDGDVRAMASRLLVYAQGHDDDAAAAVRATLRPVVLRHSAEDLAEAGPMLQAFAQGTRGLDPDAE